MSNDVNLDPRSKFQYIARQVWADQGMQGTIVLPTGVGKTKTAVEAINELEPNSEVLILTPTSNLRDNEWVSEIERWSANHDVNIGIECIQTAYRFKDQKYNLVIADEVHRMMGDEYAKFFIHNHYERIMGLTATVPEDEILRERLDEIAPVVYTLDVGAAKAHKLVSDYSVYEYPIELTRQEQREYEQADRTFRRTFDVLGNLNNLYYFMRNTNAYKSHCIRNGLDFNQVKSYPFVCNKAINTRKQVLYNAENKIAAIEQLIRKFGERRMIIFCESVQFAERILRIMPDEMCSYHSKLSKKKREQVLDDFNSNKKSIMVAVRALDAGFNVEDISMAIIASGTSKQLQSTQRIGRAIRKQEGKHAIIVQLVCNGTQEEKWAKNRMKGFEVQPIKELWKN
jgi:superfamily II DNA or RNA helicase